MSNIRQLRCNESGSVVIMVAVGLLTLITVAGGAVDYSRYLRSKSNFNNAVDQALLAAATSSRMKEDINETAARYFAANYPTSGTEVTLKSIRVTNPEGGMKWRAEATAELKTSLIKIAGIDTLTLKHSAEVTWDISSRVDAVFLADTSASMCMNIVRAPNEQGVTRMQMNPDRSCKKLKALKESLLYVIDNGLAPIQGAGGPVFNVGIVPFNHKVKLPNPAAIPSPLARIEATHAKGDPSYYSKFDDAEPLTKVLPLTAINGEKDRQTLRDSINAITQVPQGLGWTRSNIGTLTAALMLDPDYHASFGGVRPADFNPSATEKIVVMMTDGANIGCCYAAHPEGNFNNQYLYLYEVDNAHLVGLNKMPEMRKWASDYGIPEVGICDKLKQQGVKIFTVIYDVDDRDPGGKAIKDAYSYCASSPQYFFDVSTADQLKIAYKSIAQSFLKLRLSY
jgi:Flp pilus assembly protein TadG